MGFEVVGVGHCTIDCLGVVNRYPEVDTKIELQEFSMQGGGPVATAMVALASWGISVSFVGKISDDDFGMFIKQGFREAGVDIGSLRIESGQVSPYSFVVVEKSTAKRNIFWTRGNVSPLQPTELNLDLIQQAKILHVDGLLMETQIAAAQHAKKHGVHVVYDAGSPREGMEELLALTDTLIASELFATEVGGGALAESLKAMLAKGPSTVVITIGVDGSVGIENQETYVVPAISVQAVDTTGAGDVYHGAFIFGMLRGWGLKEKMRFANTAAGLKCRYLGGRLGIPSLEEIDKKMG